MSNPDTDETRRAYWTEQLEAAWHFMFEAVLPYPVHECGEPMATPRMHAATACCVCSPHAHQDDDSGQFVALASHVQVHVGAA
jgi:hypothetical protein